MRRRVLVPAAAALLLMIVAAPATAANQPGDACPVNGAFEQLGSGWITCQNGTWQPSGGPDGSTTGGSTNGGTTPPTTPSAGSASITALKAFRPVGTVLSAETFGSSRGQVADPSAIRLPDGRIRLFVFVADEGVRSATSTTAAGTTFVADPTRPIPWTMAGQPRAVSLGGSAMRLFYLSAGSIQSARSSDGGLTFTDEGPVITSEQAGFEPGGISIIKQGSGYRAYFSNLERPGVVAPRVMRTATSTDMLHWTMGPVLTQEGGSISGGGSHPFAVIDKKGRIALYYSGDRGSYYGIIVSTSRNGVTFGKERSVMAGGGDGDVLAAGKKGGLMYYGYKLPGSAGFGVNVARTTGSLVPTIR